MGCFWGAERVFWQAPGVVSTSVGYAGGHTPNPTYEEVCSGRTGHNEVVRVVFDPAVTSYDALLKLFWENHDPTQGMRQGNDVGTQYRSGIYTYTDAQREVAEASREAWLRRVTEQSFIAFSVNCAHLGCPVQWRPQAQLFLCPCHGGVYYADGTVAAGPPPRPLFQYPVRVHDGLVEIQAQPMPLG